MKMKYYASQGYNLKKIGLNRLISLITNPERQFTEEWRFKSCLMEHIAQEGNCQVDTNITVGKREIKYIHGGVLKPFVVKYSIFSEEDENGNNAHIDAISQENGRVLYELKGLPDCIRQIY